jgi:hypothetical protein
MSLLQDVLRSTAVDSQEKPFEIQDDSDDDLVNVVSLLFSYLLIWLSVSF